MQIACIFFLCEKGVRSGIRRGFDTKCAHFRQCSSTENRASSSSLHTSFSSSEIPTCWARTLSMTEIDVSSSVEDVIRRRKNITTRFSGRITFRGTSRTQYREPMLLQFHSDELLDAASTKPVIARPDPTNAVHREKLQTDLALESRLPQTHSLFPLSLFFLGKLELAQYGLLVRVVAGGRGALPTTALRWNRFTSGLSRRNSPRTLLCRLTWPRRSALVRECRATPRRRVEVQEWLELSLQSFSFSVELALLLSCVFKVAQLGEFRTSWRHKQIILRIDGRRSMSRNVGLPGGG
jgi:hypothetical protein